MATIAGWGEGMAMGGTGIETIQQLLAIVGDGGGDPSVGDNALESRQVDAKLVEDLLRRHADLLPAGEVRWAGLVVGGRLNLGNLQLDRSLAFERCWFVDSSAGGGLGSVCVEDASVPSLEFTDCVLGDLAGRGLTVGSALRVRRCDVLRQLRFVDCRVGGSMWVSGTTILAESAKENALNLYRAQISGALYGERTAEDDGAPARPFLALGRVRLIDAVIDGVVSLVGAQILNPGSTAVSGDRMKAASILLKGERTQVEGRVSLVGAQIGTTVNFRAAEFHNPGKVALQLNGLRVGFRLRLDPKVVDGSIRMRNARLGVFTYGPLAIQSCQDLDAAGTTFDTVGYMDGVNGAEGAPPSIEDLVGLLCERSPHQSASPYVQLAAVLTRQGEEEQARAVAIAGARARTAVRSPPWRWLQQLVGAPFAYGYRPERALRILVITMVVLGAAVAFNRAELAPNDSAGSCGATYPCLAPAAYAIDVVLPIVDLGQESAWHVDNSTGPGQWIQLLVWISIAVGWLASTAFVVALQRHFRG